MLKFTEFSEENIEKIAAELFGSDDYALEILNSFDFSDEDVYYAAAYQDGCMLIRIYDFGRYMFLYPIEINEDSDAESAVLAISEYARREEIGLIFTDVPSECVSSFISLGFLHLNIDAQSEESYRVMIKTECEIAPENIELEHKNITLNEIAEADSEEYAALCRDEAFNKYWGYDYREDNSQASDEYFSDTAKEDRILGTSMSLAVREAGKFVGEVQLFAFDGRGECEVAVRIARKYHSRGLGSAALEAAIKLADVLGLRKLSCDVLKENANSIAMVEKYFTEVECEYSDRKHFELEI